MSSSTTAGTDPSAILARAVEQAVLAPSSHNTQPWLFRIDGESLELYADRARGLRVNDPDDRELTVSCGAALLNARVAAEHAGAALEVELLPDGDGGDLLARARLAGGSSADARLFAAIADRRTYRRPFSDRAVPADALARLEEAAAAEGAWLDVLDGRRRAELVSLVAEGDRTQFADPRWRRELASWMRSRRAGDGLALPRLAAP